MKHRNGKNRDDKNTSRKISAMGEAAGIVVCEKKEKYASRHDIRDTFGTWIASKGISPYELQRMMRHADLKTTMVFYVDVQARDMNANIRNPFRVVTLLLPMRVRKQTPKNRTCLFLGDL